MKIRVASLAAVVFGSLLLVPGTARADEGMWLFNAPPMRQLKEKYGFEPGAEWLNRLQKASVRFNNGGSGSFVSADGLVITNHHVGADALQKFSDDRHNYLKDGFYAATRAEEKPCFDLELNVLMSIEDVTERVKMAMASAQARNVRGSSMPLTEAESAAARRAVCADIERESNEKTGLRSDVVTLYQGGSYQLYRYKRYTDVRLVFAPEQGIAFFGGDPDNFEYPRYDLDICIFRAYENGQPARPEQTLKWSANGAAEHELVFVSGHPGSTSRQLTLAALTEARDRALPHRLAQLYRRETLLISYGERSIENARRARDELFGIQNSRKAFGGELGGLLDPEFFARLVANEAGLRSRIEAAYLPGAANAYDIIAAAQKVIAENAPVYDYFEGRRAAAGFNSTLFRVARLLVRAADERTKPNGERLPTFRDSNRPSLELQLFSEEPIYDDLEQLRLTDCLTDRAAELVLGSKLKDVSLRKKLYEGGAAAMAGVSDPMIDLARAIDPVARASRAKFEGADESQQQAYAEIARARFAFEGTTKFPDATFTLRLSYGTVEGYQEAGKAVPALTDFGGLYQRSAEHENRAPFDLPVRWVEGKGRLKMDTPFNFASTADIIGGNSGSPTVNRAGEFVGIIFDGNIQSLPLDYAYTDKQARAVSVDSRAILEALRQIYHADGLVAELTNR